MVTHVTKALSPVKGRRLRVTRLDACGRPVYGDDSQATTKGFVTVGFTANTTESDEINVTNAAGETCVYEASVQQLVGYGLEIGFCRVDPDLISIITGQPVVLGPDGNTVIGFDVDTQITLSEVNFAFELWMGAPAGNACDTAGATGTYGYLLLPFLNGGILGDFSVENGAVTFTVTGAATREGNAWGVGPYKDIMLGPGPVNEVQTVTITGNPTGGTFRLTFDGQQTAPIPFGADNAAVRTALEALSNINVGDITSGGGDLPIMPVQITFTGQYAGDNVPMMTATSSLTGGTSPGVTIATLTSGSGDVPSAMSSPVSTTTALRLIETNLTPPEFRDGARPLLDPSLASLTSITTAVIGRAVDFDTVPVSTGPVYYEFGDGTWDYVVAPGETNHTYAGPGTYTVTASQNGKWVSTNVVIAA